MEGKKGMGGECNFPNVVGELIEFVIKNDVWFFLNNKQIYKTRARARIHTHTHTHTKGV